jgi:hypothetical protein
MLQAVVVLVIIIISLLVTVVSLVLKQVGNILYIYFPVSVSVVDPKLLGRGGSGLNHSESTTLVSDYIYILCK